MRFLLLNHFSIKLDAVTGGGDYLDTLSFLIGFDSKSAVIENMLLNPDPFWFSIYFLDYIE